MMGRILCAWSPNWAIDNWRRRNSSDSPAEPEGAPRPFALIESVKGVRRLAAADRAAARLGLYAGQKATDAAALVPDLLVAEAEPQADAAALAALADWCVRFSPAVALDAPDGLFLDISGVSHLWDGEAPMMADLRRRLAANGLFVRCAVADTPGAAWALAHFGAGSEIVAPPGEPSAGIARLPPAALRLSPEAAVQIERLGLKTVRQLLALPRAPLARRFGAEILTRLDHALGRTKEALNFRRPPNPWFARLAFAEPISTPEDLARVSFDIAVRLCARLEREGKGAKRFDLAYHRLDGRAETVSVGLSAAGRDPARIAKLMAPKLENVDPGFGIEVATLAAEAVEPLSGRQARLDTLRETSLQEALAPLADRLINRLGEGRVWKSAPAESHLPELSSVCVPPLSELSAQGWDPERPRPLRLFRRPERVESVIAPVPDDPPVQFRWRNRLHRVRRSEGPERIAAEWWKAGAGEVTEGEIRIDRVRDYYRVEDEEGGRFWLYRAGLHQPDAPAKWWLHGLFG